LSVKETVKQLHSVATEELALVRRLIRDPGTHLNLPRYFEIFEQEEWQTRRSHACFVMEPLSCLQHWIVRAGYGLPAHAYKKLARQVLQALQFLHEEWNLIYVGKSPN
jgi:serine/threonine protein kinase